MVDQLQTVGQLAGVRLDKTHHSFIGIGRQPVWLLPALKGIKVSSNGLVVGKKKSDYH